MELAEVFQKLEDGSKRLTPQREHIIRIFAERPGEQLSAEEVRALIRERYGDVGLATVYRTLELLTDLTILERNTMGDGRAHYLFPIQPTRTPPVMVCVRCGASVPVRKSVRSALASWLDEHVEFDLVDYEMKLYGTCPPCQGRARTANGGGL